MVSGLSKTSSSIAWSIDLHKCIDASPLVVVCRQRRTTLAAAVGGEGEAEGLEDAMVYVGSHSHVFVGAELATGREVWRTELPDRVESTACVSVCGNCVAVGKYVCVCVYNI